MDWSTVFAQQHPQPGATDQQIRAFTESVLLPLSADEIAEINATQRNPFPRTDPLHSAYRPFDPTAWMLPLRDLPETYLSFLRWSNGGHFGNGERWFQFFQAVAPGHGVREMLLGHNLPKYMPGVLPFALNGGGSFYLFDMRAKPKRGEYPIVTAHSGYLSWNKDAWHPVADTFLEACQGAVSMDEIRCGYLGKETRQFRDDMTLNFFVSPFAQRMGSADNDLKIVQA